MCNSAPDDPTGDMEQGVVMEQGDVIELGEDMKHGDDMQLGVGMVDKDQDVKNGEGQGNVAISGCDEPNGVLEGDQVLGQDQSLDTGIEDSLSQNEGADSSGAMFKGSPDSPSSGDSGGV